MRQKMSQQWYCQVMGSTVGPLTSSQLREMAQSGRLAPDDPIRKADSTRWAAASHVKGLFDPAPKPTPPPQNQPTPPPLAPRPAASNASTHPEEIHQQIRGRTGYASQNLTPGENILYAASIHPLIFLPSAIFFLCLISGIITGLYAESLIGDSLAASDAASDAKLMSQALIVAGLALLFFAPNALIIFFTTECVLTDRRVLAKTGLISRESTELLLSKVEGLQVKQGILGRIFDFGTVTITGTGGSASPFPGIARPLNFRKRVQEQIEIQ
jgi:hypothetical protein